jgi:hypothetical protein
MHSYSDSLDFNSNFNYRARVDRPIDEHKVTSFQQTKLPEHLELDRLDSDLSNLLEQLAEAELAIETEKISLSAFRQLYLQQIGTLYAQRDQLIADLCAIRAGARPEDIDMARAAKVAQEAARLSSREAKQSSLGPALQPTPTPELKAVYRKAAKMMHPDRSVDVADQIKRNDMMARANLAYAAGDIVGLEALLQDYVADPDAFNGDSIEQKLVKTIRKIAQIKRRLAEIETELLQLKESDLAVLHDEVKCAEELGLDPLSALKAQLLSEMSDLKIELELLRKR